MNNLWTVIKFELIRTFKKPSFWIGVLSLPAIWLIVGGIAYFTGQQTTSQMEELAKETFSFEITDESQIVSPKSVEDLGGKISTNKQSSIEKVQKSELDAYYFIPKDLSKEKVEVYGLNQEFGKNDRYQTFISNLLKNSSIETVDQNKIAAINSSLLVDQKIYKDGQEYNQIYEMIAPGIFLVIFYLVIVLLSNQMLTSTTEEKENRVTEMMALSEFCDTVLELVGEDVSDKRKEKQSQKQKYREMKYWADDEDEYLDMVA
jgi:ABC-2 type transport system permease protein